MASYRFSAQVVSRKSGRSSVAASAYRAAANLDDERTGQQHDYTRKRGVEHAEILTPDNAPDWMKDRGKLWNAVEAVERRKDAQLAREIQLSLPHELSPEQRIELARSFVNDHFVNVGMIADIAIHNASHEGDPRNVHAHVMLTMRELTGDGFGKKARAWNDKALLETWREQWADYQNAALEAAGIAARVDHRTLEAQEIDREPQKHEGVTATAMKRKGKDADRTAQNDAIKQRNNQRRSDHMKALHEMAKVQEERQRFQEWQAQQMASMDSAQRTALMDFDTEQQLEKLDGEDAIKEFYEPALKASQEAAEELEAITTAKGIRATIRRLWRGQKDKDELAAYKANIADAQKRIKEARDKMDAAHTHAKEEFIQRQKEAQKAREDGLRRAEERKEEGLRQRYDEAAKRAQETAAPNADLGADFDKVKSAREEWKEKNRQRLKEAANKNEAQERGQDRGYEP